MSEKSITIHDIQLTNFRPFESYSLHTDADLVILTGQNGIGKTTVFEALSVVAVVKSFRTNHLADLIKWGKSFFHVKVKLKIDSDCHVAAVSYGSHPDKPKMQAKRKLLWDESPVDKIVDFIGKIPTVLFVPDDLAILDTTPAARRRFIDYTLSFIKPGYLRALQMYAKALKMRAGVLKSSSLDSSYLDAIEQELAKSGFFIRQVRQEFLQEFQSPFAEKVAFISNYKDAWQLEYQPSPKKQLSSMEDYKEVLRQSRKEDFRRKANTVGIHRDRIYIRHSQVQDKDIKEVASQGQKRTASLALKMAQYEYTAQKIHIKPVLLIDDVLNELDALRRAAFLEFLQNIGQAWVTITDTSSLQSFLKTNPKKTDIIEIQ